MTDVETTSRPQSLRERISDSRLGTVLVLAVTSVLVLGGAYLVDHSSATGAGVTVVRLTGPHGSAPKIGRPAPDFMATTTDGHQVSLSSFKGQAVWLTFGATWCSACQAESPDIEAAYEKAKPTGAVVLAVFISEGPSDVRDYAHRIGLSYPQVADPQTTIASEYQVLGIPAHFFIDRSGLLRSMRTGSLSPERMDAALAEISG